MARCIRSGRFLGTLGSLPPLFATQYQQAQTGHQTEQFIHLFLPAFTKFAGR